MNSELARKTRQNCITNCPPDTVPAPRTRC